MWQILLNSERLDLLSNWQPSFSRKNNAFSFGNLELSRTQSFTLPRTPRNDAAFAVGADYHNAGARMRVFHEAWLYGDSVSYNGSLYVDDADRSGYKCVFVFGELEALKALSEVKKLTYETCGVDEQMRPIQGGVSRGLSHSVPANNADSLNYAFVNRRYTNRTSALATSFHNPSVKVAKLFENIQSLFGLTIEIPQECADLCIVLDKVKGQTDRSVTISKSGINAMTLSATEVLKVSTRYTDITYYNGQGLQSRAFKWFEVVEDCEVVFPLSFPDDVYMCDGYEVPNFFGGYSFNTSANVAVRQSLGKPLGGRKVKLSAKDEQGNPIRYGFFKKDLYQNSGSGATRIQGFQQGQDASAYSYKVHITSVAAVKPNTDHNYWLRDNYPDVGYMDLIKTIATICGKFVYLDGSTIKFAPYNIETWNVLSIDKVLSIQSIQRRFSDFGQKGVFAFDTAAYVNDVRPQEYTISNATLKAESSIYKIPLNDGDGISSNTESLFIDDWWIDDSKDTDKETNDADGQTLAHIGTDTDLTRAAIERIADLQTLCDVSTAIEASVSMTAFEFNQLKDNDLVWLGGSLWVWLEANYSKDVVRLSLQKWK